MGAVRAGALKERVARRKGARVRPERQPADASIRPVVAEFGACREVTSPDSPAVLAPPHLASVVFFEKAIAPHRPALQEQGPSRAAKFWGRTAVNGPFGRKPGLSNTRMPEMFGVETPLVMGGMTGVGYAPLVAAVANAGALGFITA